MDKNKKKIESNESKIIIWKKKKDLLIEEVNKIVEKEMVEK